jgi:predicted Zn-dependent protease
MVLAAGQASARTEILKTQAGSPVHWTRAEITIAVDNAARSRYLDRLDVALAVERAARAWNRIPASQPRLRLASSPKADVTIRFCQGKWQGATIDLGRTQFRADPADGSVSAATVELNECDHQLTAAGGTVTDLYDLQSVLTHELGHVFGLGHSDNSTAVMYPNGQGAITRIPHPDDETALAVLYVGRGSSDAEPPLAGAPMAPGPPAHAAHSARAATASDPSDKEPPAAASRPPVDSVSALNVKGSGGREVTIFTCEPTLLPAIADSQTGKKPQPTPRTGARAKPRK